MPENTETAFKVHYVGFDLIISLKYTFNPFLALNYM